jgi:formylglycine-generating enzyme
VPNPREIPHISVLRARPLDCLLKPLVFEPLEETPPSSQTPVVFETAARDSAVPSKPRSQKARPSLAHRLAPVAILPLLFAVLAGFWLKSVDSRGVAKASPSEAKPVEYMDLGGDDGVEMLSLCPENMSLVIRDKMRVCVDRWEASLVEVKNGVETPHSPYVTPNTWQSTVKYKAVSVPGVVPQAYVSKYQAQIACTNAGKRLCRAEEWKVACEGPTKTTYPYGDKEDRKACNTHGKNPLPLLLGSSKTFMWGDAMHHPLLNTFPGTLAKTGEFEKCANEYGLHDMVGNLHEWTADGDFRGGYYRDDKSNAPGCRYRTSAHGPTYSDYSTGFRCCADPH